jgi:hypothetical protein
MKEQCDVAVLFFHHENSLKTIEPRHTNASCFALLPLLLCRDTVFDLFLRLSQDKLAAYWS